MSWSTPEIFGRTAEGPPLSPGHPAIGLYAEWQWLRALRAILQFSRWTIDDVVSSRQVAAEIRCYWKLYRAGQRLARERQDRLALEEQCWFRRQGCPVPCPICGCLQECSCEVPAPGHWSR